MSVRLDKLLANLGYGSRREIQLLARAGRIELDGRAVAGVDHKVPVEPDLVDRLRIDGEPVDPLPGLVVMLHKPLGMTCSHKESGPLVYSLLPARWRRRDPAISSIGRLDKDTSGLLLLTDDGAFLHKVISPKTHLPKRYRVDLARPLRGDEAVLFASGTMLLEGETKPLRPGHLAVETPTRVALTIIEGRYHQVRRMFAAVGNHVEALHRDSIGALTLDPALEPGMFASLDRAAIDRIFGGESLVTDP